jgi:2-desacetyl-2-hydroxyethyl bacteriochlorophyllide A dehydrogenase
MAGTKKTMRALVARGIGDYRVGNVVPEYKIEEVPIPNAGEGEMIVKVEACGICIGDVKMSHLQEAWGGKGTPPHLTWPFTPGHEFIGHVVEIGHGVKGDFKIGDRVTSEQIVPCGYCKNCLSGKYWMCLNGGLYGTKFKYDGGMAEYMKFQKGAINYKVADNIPLETAVLIEPYACGKHAVDRGEIQNNDVVVLSGAGALGLGMLEFIRMKNPKLAIVLDIKEKRLEVAKQLGADIVLNPAKEDVVAKVMELTDGIGCDVYIEATGFPSSVQQGLDIIKRLGTFVEFGFFIDPISINWTIVGDAKELNIHGSHLGPYCYKPVLEWMANGRISTRGVVTHKFALEDFKKGFETAGKGEDSIKVVLVP